LSYLFVLGILCNPWCAHKIRFKFYDGLPLDIISQQWKLDIRSFFECDIMQNNEQDSFPQLLHGLERRYREWSLSKKKIVRKQIELFLRESDPFSYKPLSTSHKSRPSTSKLKWKQLLHNAILLHLKLFKRGRNVRFMIIIVGHVTERKISQIKLTFKDYWNSWWGNIVGIELLRMQ